MVAKILGMYVSMQVSRCFSLIDSIKTPLTGGFSLQFEIGGDLCSPASASTVGYCSLRSRYPVKLQIYISLFGNHWKTFHNWPIGVPLHIYNLSTTYILLLPGKHTKSMNSRNQIVKFLHQMAMTC